MMNNIMNYQKILNQFHSQKNFYNIATRIAEAENPDIK